MLAKLGLSDRSNHWYHGIFISKWYLAFMSEKNERKKTSIILLGPVKMKIAKHTYKLRESATPSSSPQNCIRPPEISANLNIGHPGINSETRGPWWSYISHMSKQICILTVEDSAKFTALRFMYKLDSPALFSFEYIMTWLNLERRSPKEHFSQVILKLVSGFWQKDF